MYPYLVDERNRLSHGFRHLCVLLPVVGSPEAQKEKEYVAMTTQRGLQICAYVQRQKQTKEKRTLRITEKKIHGFKNKSNWGA